jgi:uncharacterized protein
MTSLRTTPGVYIVEVPSSVHTIVGVPTSVTAIIGQTERGPLNQAVRISSFLEYQRKFGDTAMSLPLSWAVQLFFLNGGAVAQVVRSGSGGTRTTVDVGSEFSVKASSEGAWANGLSVQIDQDQIQASLKATRFNMTVSLPPGPGGAAPAQERYVGLTVETLQGAVQRSQLITVDTKPTGVPQTGHYPAAQHEDGAAAGGAAAGGAGAGGAAAGSAGAGGAAAGGPGAGGAEGAAGSAAGGVGAGAAGGAAPAGAEGAAGAAAGGAAGGAAAGGAAGSAAGGVGAGAAGGAAAGGAAGSAAGGVGAGAAGGAAAAGAEGAGGAAAGGAAGGAAAAGAGGAAGAKQPDPTFTPQDAIDSALPALAHLDEFNLLCLPVEPGDSQYSKAQLEKAAAFCRTRRAVLLADPLSSWTKGTLDTNALADDLPIDAGQDEAANVAVYYPNLTILDTNGASRTVGPSGALAGIFARTDATRGVSKSPAGTDSGIAGIAGLSAPVDDDTSGVLNTLGINALRTFPLYGPVVWGSRTAKGADALGDQWKYLAVRRTALFIEESLFRGTKWVVFEPNAESLWAALRLNIGVFMNALWRQGAFAGATKNDAYFVQCDVHTNPQDQVDLGIVNVLVGFAPLKPAEFVVISIQQIAGQLQT